MAGMIWKHHSGISERLTGPPPVPSDVVSCTLVCTKLKGGHGPETETIWRRGQASSRSTTTVHECGADSATAPGCATTVEMGTVHTADRLLAACTLPHALLIPDLAERGDPATLACVLNVAP